MFSSRGKVLVCHISMHDCGCWRVIIVQGAESPVPWAAFEPLQLWCRPLCSSGILSLPDQCALDVITSLWQTSILTGINVPLPDVSVLQDLGENNSQICQMFTEARSMCRCTKNLMTSSWTYYAPQSWSSKLKISPQARNHAHQLARVPKSSYSLASICLLEVDKLLIRPIECLPQIRINVLLVLR